MGETIVEKVAMNIIIEAINKIFTGAMEWAQTVGTTIVGNPLLLFGVVIGFVGLGVGLFKRLLHV